MTLTKWRIHLFVLLTSALIPTYAKSADCIIVEDFIKSYYADLQRNDVDSARVKWLRASSSLAKLIKKIETTSVNKLNVEECTSTKAVIETEVTVKKYKNQEEHWKGKIYLKSVRSSWKIKKLALKSSESKNPKSDDSTSACQSAEDLVRAYYGDLDINDIDSARVKWRTPPPNLSRFIKNIEIALVNEVKLEKCSSSQAILDANVVIKLKQKEEEYWTGKIKLQRIRGNWKLLTLKGLKQY